MQAAARNPQTQHFHSIALDVTSSEANDHLITEATKWNDDTPPDIIWANAGASVPSLFLDSSPATLRSQMDTNYFAAAFLAQSSLCAWLAHPNPPVSNTDDGKPPSEEGRARHFIMTSSVAALVAIAGYAPYSPAKAALRSLHDDLSSELNLYNGAFSKAPAPQPPQIKSHLVFPGTILSPGLELENTTKHKVTTMLEGSDTPQSAEEAAKRAIEELQNGRSMPSTQGWMGEVVKGSAWQGSTRDQPILDTLMSWATSVIWLFVSWDMKNKVWKMGEKEGVPQHARVEKR